MALTRGRASGRRFNAGLASVRGQNALIQTKSSDGFDCPSTKNVSGRSFTAPIDELLRFLHVQPTPITPIFAVEGAGMLQARQGFGHPIQPSETHRAFELEVVLTPPVFTEEYIEETGRSGGSLKEWNCLCSKQCNNLGYGPVRLFVTSRSPPTVGAIPV